MKNIVCILAFIIISFSSFVQSEKLTQIKFNSFSRGFKETIAIREDSTIILRVQSGMNSKIVRTSTTNLEWQQLIQSLGNNQLNELVNLASPTNHRQVDLAPYSDITLITTTHEYNSGYFDGYHPNDKLTALMKVIQETRKNKL